MHCEGPQLDQPHAQLVVAAMPAEPAQLHQSFEHPMRRGAWQPGAPHDLSQREPARSVESVQDQRNAIDDGARSKGIGLARHSSSPTSGISNRYMPIDSTVWRPSQDAKRGTPARAPEVICDYEFAAARPARRP